VAACEKAGRLARFPAAARVIAPVTDLRILFRLIIPLSPVRLDAQLNPSISRLRVKIDVVDAIGQEETCRLRDSLGPHLERGLQVEMNATKGLSLSCDRIDFDERDASSHGLHAAAASEFPRCRALRQLGEGW
jgi:hypothetical protein